MKPYYQDAAVTLYHGDCRELVESVCDEVQAAAMIADPPYGETTFKWDKWPTR